MNSSLPDPHPMSDLVCPMLDLFATPLLHQLAVNFVLKGRPRGKHND